MKAIIDFIKYNNAFPIILSVTLLGTGAAFAASPELRQSVFVPETMEATAPMKADASKLLSADFAVYDHALRIDAIQEDAAKYAVTYSYQTFEIRGATWQESRKTKHMDIDKTLLGKRDLKSYLSLQISQVMDQEMAYLKEAQRLAGGAPTVVDSPKYAALVGQGIEKEATESEQDDREEEEAAPLPEAPVAEEAAPLPTDLSKEEIQKMIVAAVAEFLAIDTSMPAAAEEPLPVTSSSSEELPATETTESDTDQGGV